MKRFAGLFVASLVGAVVSVGWATEGAKKPEKAAVYVDSFDVHEGCGITPGGVALLKDRIIGNVVSSRKYLVVERDYLDKLQEELKLVDAGVVDSVKMPRSNELIAAGYRIYGKVMQYRNFSEKIDMPGGGSRTWLYGTVELQIRLANISSGRILASPGFTIKEKMRLDEFNGVKSNQNLEQEVMMAAVQKAAKKIVIALNEIAFPVYMTDADGTFITGNVGEAQVTKGELWDVWRRRGVKRNPETDEIEGFREKFVCKVRVAQPGPKETKFKALSAKDGKMLEDEFEAIADLPRKDRVTKGIVLRLAQDEEQVPDKKPDFPPFEDALGL